MRRKAAHLVLVAMALLSFAIVDDDDDDANDVPETPPAVMRVIQA